MTTDLQSMKGLSMKKGLVCLISALLVTGCALCPSETKQSADEAVVLTLASFGNDSKLRKQIDLFNREHPDYQIEIKQYYRCDRPEEDGINRLRREILSGKGPDLINYGGSYLITDVMGKYTENLFPYLEGEQSDFFTNIWNAFAYQDGLYAIPVDFTLRTYAAARSLTGERKSWTIEEMIVCYEEEYEKADGFFMLYPGETKKDVFGSLITGNIGNYVDWENGTCNFDSGDFKKILAFSNRFPDKLVITEEFSPMELFSGKKALLLPLSVRSVYDICRPQLLFREEAACIGYPTEGTDGTVIVPGNTILAVSTGSRHKDAAWEFISQFLTAEYQESLTDTLPLCRSALEKQLFSAMTEEYIQDSNGRRTLKPKSEIIFEGEEPVNIYKMSEAQKDALSDIIQNASIASSFDSGLHTILLEEAESYFSGDRPLEETVKVMQSRARIYIKERL